MADRKISELSSLTGANSADDDVLVIVDTSADETKKITLGELENALAERDFSLDDDDKLLLGSSNDGELYHNGTNAYLESNTGDLRIIANEADKDVRIYSDNGSGGTTEYFRADGSIGQALLFHYGTKKFNTTSLGIDITQDDDGSSSGPILDLMRESDSPADLDFIGRIDFSGKNDADENQIYGQIIGQITDATDGTEDGSLRITTKRNGSLRSRVQVNTTNTTFNEDSQDFDFRIETDGQANMLFVDGGNDRIGIKTGSPAYDFDVNGAGRFLNTLHLGSNPSNAGQLNIADTSATNYVMRLKGTGTRAYQFEGSSSGAAYYLSFTNENASGGFHITTYGGLSVNEGGMDADFRVETPSYANAFLVDASANKTYINTPNSEIASKLTINNHGSTTGHLQFQTATNESGNNYVRANIVFSRDNNQITWDDTSDEWVHAGGSSTDWSMMTHTSGEFRLFHGPSYSTETRWSNDDFKTNFRVMEINNDNGWKFEAPQGGSFVFNDRGINRDFRVESDTNTHALFVDAGSSEVGINTSSPSGPLHVVGGNNGEFWVDSWGTLNQEYNDNTVSQHNWTGAGNAYFKQYNNNNSTNTLTNVIRTDGETVFNEGSFDNDFRVESNNNGTMIFVNAGSDRVSIGMNGGSEVFNVKGSIQLDHEGSDGFAKIVGPDNRTLKVVLRANDNNDAFLVEDDRSAGSERLTVNAGAEMVVNDTSADYDFRVESNDTTHMLFVDAGSNKVGIGTSTPQALLHVNGSGGGTAPNIFLENASGSEGDITFDSGEILQVGTWDTSTSTFGELFTLHNNGGVNFAITNDFQIGRNQGGSGYDSGERHLYIWAGASTDYTQISGRNGADGSPLFRAFVGGTLRAEIEANGDFLSNTNSYGSTSDQTLKENIVSSGSQWDDLKAVQVKKFSYIADDLDEANMIGVIAQDLEASGMGGLVSSMEHDDGTTYKTVKYSILYMKAIKALQEAMERIETLETKVAALESAS